MDFTADYRAARQAFYDARERNAFDAMGIAAAESDRILDAADAAGVDIDIAAIEDECAPTFAPASYRN